jgi:hypothetical protein
MRFHPALPAILLSAATLALPAAAGAQSVPEELVRALVANGGADRPPAVIVVAGVPHEFPADAVPSGRVLGGVGGDPAASEVVVAVADAPPAAVDAGLAKLAAVGWSSGGGRGQRGFVAPSTNAFGLACKGTDGMTVSAAPAPGGGSYLRLSYMSAAHANPCSGIGGRPRPGTGPADEIPMPALTAPAGAVATSTSNGQMMGGMGREPSVESRVRLRTTQSPSELLAHYAGQLRGDGWTAASPAASGEGGMQTFRKSGENGKTWFGVLTAIALPDSQLRDVAFSVSPLPAGDGQ